MHNDSLFKNSKNRHVLHNEDTNAHSDMVIETNVLPMQWFQKYQDTL